MNTFLNLRAVIAAPLFFVLFLNCKNSSEQKSLPSVQQERNSKADTTKNASNPGHVNAATILARKEVPILCYHHIKDVLPRQSELFVTTANFKAQMKILHDSGYHTILPDQLYDYLVNGAQLPEKPFMITYDDNDEDGFSIAKTEMDKYGFKGVYFIMTITLNKPNYMSKEQLKQLLNEGHVIASHTWDHHRVDRYSTQGIMKFANGKTKAVNDYDVQFSQPKKTLEEILGKPVEYFAYPYGLWKPEAIPELKSRGIKMAFILATKRDSTDPLYTVRRTMVPSTWTPQGMLKVMRSAFK